MARKRLTDKGIAALKPRAARYAEPVPQLAGLYVRVQPSGAKSFVTVAREPATGRQVWKTGGATDVTTVEEACEWGREVLKRVRSGLPAVEPPPVKPDTFADIAGQWLKRHVEAKGLRSRREIERVLTAYVLPVWKDRAFVDIRRSDVAKLLDGVEDNHGDRQADAVLAHVSSVMNWYATRNDDYTPPIVRGMRRTSMAARARIRILDDSEIKTLWQAAERNGVLGGLVRVLLITGQRRAKVAGMKWSDIALDGTWTIAREAREKGAPPVLVLPPMALDIVRQQQRVDGNPFVFPGVGGKPFNSFGRGKAALKLPADWPQWQLHDLRRCARSLMARAGVQPHIAERVLGHVQPGVQGTYDRHGYTQEIADALARLAALIDGIVNPRANVVPMAKPR